MTQGRAPHTFAFFADVWVPTPRCPSEFDLIFYLCHNYVIAYRKYLIPDYNYLRIRGNAGTELVDDQCKRDADGGNVRGLVILVLYGHSYIFPNPS